MKELIEQALDTLPTEYLVLLNSLILVRDLDYSSKKNPLHEYLDQYLKSQGIKTSYSEYERTNDTFFDHISTLANFFFMTGHKKDIKHLATHWPSK